MAVHWEGYYFDGITPEKHPARITFAPSYIEIVLEDGRTLRWQYSKVRCTHEFHNGNRVCLEKGDEMIVVPHEGFVEVMDRLHGTFSSRVGKLLQKRWFLWAVVAGTGTIVVTAIIYIWGIPLLVNTMAERIPPSWEDSLGRMVVEEFLKGSQRCESMEAHVMRMLERLEEPITSHPYRFKVYVVKNDAVNALAAPGGHIMIFTGLLELTERAEELAGVLAHEMEHVLERHPTRSILQNLSTSLLLTLISGDTGMSDVVGEAVFTLGTLHYSRTLEDEADRMGMELLIKARIDPQGMIDFFRTMESQRGDIPESLRYLSTHPLTSERIERLTSRMKEWEGKKDYKPLLPGLDWKEIVSACKTDAEETPPSKMAGKRDNTPAGCRER